MELLGPTVPIWTTAGRIHIPFVCDSKQKALLQSRTGETDLSVRKGKFYLSATRDIKEPALIKISDALGVDLGIKNIAVDSDGTVHPSTFAGGRQPANRSAC